MAAVATRSHDVTLTSPVSESFIDTTASTSVSQTPQIFGAGRGAQKDLPSIVDRRKEAYLSGRSKSTIRPAKLKRSATTPSIHISMADGDVNIEKQEHQEAEVAESDQDTAFEDAPDTPKAKIHPVDPVSIDGDAPIQSSTTQEEEDSTTSEAVESSEHKNVATSPENTSSPGDLKSLPSKPRPLSQRLISLPSQGRDRSLSPGRFPVKIEDGSTSRSASPARDSGHESPTKRQTSDVSTIDILPPSAIDLSQPTPPPAGQQSPPLSGGMFRKASSGFGGLLGRMGSIRKTTMSPPARGAPGIERLDSASSSGYHDHISIASLAAIADTPEDGERERPSLQDRFKTLRRQEEQTDHDDDEQEEDEQAEGTEHEEIEADPLHDEADAVTNGPVELSSTRTKRASSTLSILKPLPPNHDLPPGTASGMSAGPAKEPTPVDWDFWQTVVCEGPAAVARTSGEELSRAIASGIPAAIRGVVWQVLAESKSDELESLYKTLKTRGSEAEAKPLSLARTVSGVSQATPSEQQSNTSSRSSIHSTSSSTEPTASSTTTQSASVEASTTELQNKLLAEKHKREAAAIQRLEKAIKRDMGSRTSYSKYTQSAGLQDGLFGVCKAYALFDTPIGYAQGINFIAMPLLFNMPEEEAFTLLVRMMHHYQLRTLFEPDMPGLHLRLYQFERLLEDLEPALFCHLKRRHVSPQLYATQWFLTLFAYRFPLQLVLRVYDLLFSEGLTAILKFGLVLMQKNRDALLEMKDMSQLTNFLKEKVFDAYIDKSPSSSSILDSGFFGSVTGGADKELYRADELVQDVARIKILPETLTAFEAEWDEQRRVERAREVELDGLRTANSTLSTQIKALEERVQQHDTEHVGLASDLVKYKIENDTLHDAKEALEVQVEELQKMVDTQPAEVEQKLKAEMDRIMQRNLEVQNENRHLQDELENAEQQLIKISMTHAETQAEFDTLRQKWSGLQAMMNGK